MEKVPLEELFQPLLLKRIEGEVEGPVTGLAYHSARVKPGNLFFCLPGRRYRGWEFAQEALQRGAVALVMEEEVPLEGGPVIRVPDVRLALALVAAIFYRHPSRRLRLIGVTGTNGKTSTTYFIESLFKARGEVTGLVGTVGGRIGENSFPVEATTPEASDLQRLLYQMARRGVKHALMEVSSHGLELKRVSGCQFSVAVLTNITGEHLDFHRDFDSYVKAKAKLFAALAGLPVEHGRPKVAVINADDPCYRRIAESCPGQKITYGIYREADLRATRIKYYPRRVSFHLEALGEEVPIELPVPGLFNVYNALAALAVGLVEGLSPVEMGRILSRVKGAPGRFEFVDRGQDFEIVIDYAHTPDGLENVLKTGRRLSRGRLITVFGCGGERDRSKRVLMGEAAGRYSDLALVTNDNPRGEDPEQIFREILPGLKSAEYLVLPDRREAIEKALRSAQPGDMVIIAGKGHEEYQVLQDRVVPFSDRRVAGELVAKILAERRKMGGVNRE
ncbi:MAG: UDP-N-acetylmuramoyl-L-alanyl-D-glutamate--2,6-diaminopimelate ligase [Firmicutes bacterium]|nr:UDP-N-acetylmuramoyl-L-alanyl-D-glutamate--2,6-diaminopimelate ligase [Bacillota bacterium]